MHNYGRGRTHLQGFPRLIFGLAAHFAFSMLPDEEKRNRSSTQLHPSCEKHLNSKMRFVDMLSCRVARLMEHLGTGDIESRLMELIDMQDELE